jgi:alanine dehydrogenase
MPGAVPVTSTWALTNATMPYVLKLATDGVHDALASDPGFLDGLSVAGGKLTSQPVAEDQGRDWVPPVEALSSVPAAA